MVMGSRDQSQAFLGNRETSTATAISTHEFQRKWTHSMSSAPKMPGAAAPFQAEHVDLVDLGDVLQEVAALRDDQDVQERQPVIVPVRPDQLARQDWNPRQQRCRHDGPQRPSLDAGEGLTHV